MPFTPLGLVTKGGSLEEANLSMKLTVNLRL